MSNKQRILEFDVEQQRLTRTPDCDFSGLVAGSVGYLKAKFHFLTEEWSDCAIAASFWRGDEEYARLLDENLECDIPPEVLTRKTFRVSLTGKSGNYLIRTTKTLVRQGVG